MKDRLHRVPFTRPVHILWAGTVSRARRMLAANVSHGGMFVRSDAAVVPGTKLALSLEARGRALPFAEAEVIWTRDSTQALQPGQLPGFGIRFLRFLHPRGAALLDFLVHRKAAHLPPELANQQIGAHSVDLREPATAAGSAPEARPPEDFMHTPIDELGDAENTSSPKWTLDLESEETPIPEVPELEPESEVVEESGGWFQNPRAQQASALEAADSGARVGTAAVLVAFLVIVAVGLLWVIRRDSVDEPGDAPAVEQQVAANEAAAVAPSDTHEILLPAADEAAQPEPAPAPTPAEKVAEPVRAVAPPSPAPEVVRPAPAPAKIATPTPAPAPSPVPAIARAPQAAAATKIALNAGAIDAVAISRSGRVLTAQLSLERGASIDRVFVLSGPSRAVIDLAGPSPKGSVKAASKAPVVEGVRVGARPGGTRVVLDLSAPASSAAVVDGVVRIELK